MMRQVYAFTGMFFVAGAIIMSGVASDVNTDGSNSNSSSRNHSNALNTELEACEQSYDIVVSSVNPALIAYDEDTLEKRSAFAEATAESGLQLEDVSNNTTVGEVTNALDSLAAEFEIQSDELLKEGTTEEEHAASINSMIFAADELQNACLDLGFAGPQEEASDSVEE